MIGTGKWKTVFLAAVTAFSCLTVSVKAEQENEDFSDTVYWTSLCADPDSLSASEKSACQAYQQYADRQSEQLKETLEETARRSEEISLGTEDYEAQIEAYQKQYEFLNGRVEEVQVQIDELQGQIDQDLQDLDELKQKVLAQMTVTQPTMRLSSMIPDLIFSAKSFADLLRIVQGISDIAQYHQKNIKTLSSRTETLKQKQDDLKECLDLLETGKEGILSMQYAAAAVKEQFEGQHADQKEYYENLYKEYEVLNVPEENTSDSKTGTEKETEEKVPQEEEKPEASAKPESSPAPTPTPVPSPAPTPVPEQPAETAQPETEIEYQDTPATASGIYGLLTRTYGFTKAAACGILANMYIESRYNPQDEYYIYYGLCQWGGGRLDHLFEFCEENGYPYDSVNGQVAFMYYEMGYSMRSMINSYEDSAEGASEAGVYFRTVFERSAGLNNVGAIAEDIYTDF